VASALPNHYFVKIKALHLQLLGCTALQWDSPQLLLVRLIHALYIDLVVLALLG
jgi:hypothetical protein